MAKDCWLLFWLIPRTEDGGDLFPPKGWKYMALNTEYRTLQESGYLLQILYLISGQLKNQDNLHARNAVVKY
jgi:hypothetical protein